VHDAACGEEHAPCHGGQDEGHEPSRAYDEAC
jgi:hypothetical protein